MSATHPTQKKTDELRGKASLIGIDGHGDRHYVVAPGLGVEGRPVLVETGDGVDTYNLEDTPCIDQPDPVDAWMRHVQHKRGSWEYVAYDRSLAELVADALEGQR